MKYILTLFFLLKDTHINFFLCLVWENPTNAGSLSLGWTRGAGYRNSYSNGQLGILASPVPLNPPHTSVVQGRMKSPVQVNTVYI